MAYPEEVKAMLEFTWNLAVVLYSIVEDGIFVSSVSTPRVFRGEGREMKALLLLIFTPPSVYWRLDTDSNIGV